MKKKQIWIAIVVITLLLFISLSIIIGTDWDIVGYAFIAFGATAFIVTAIKDRKK
jgi:hypothetical protein